MSAGVVEDLPMVDFLSRCPGGEPQGWALTLTTNN